jgi:hypothetical protein
MSVFPEKLDSVVTDGFDVGEGELNSRIKRDVIFRAVLTVGETGGAGTIVAKVFQRNVGFGVVIPSYMQGFLFFVDGDFGRDHELTTEKQRSREQLP